MTDIPPFSGTDARCPKCRSGVATDHQPAGTAFAGSVREGFRWRFSAGADEWLLRTCAECGYCWPEACADAHVATMFEGEPDV